MLQTDDYHARYYCDDRRTFQLSKYYLSKWGIIERNASQLDKHYSEMAFILFNTLKEMTEEERKFLSEKYRVTIPMKAHRPDREVAEEYGMELQEYRKLRKGVEYKFYSYLKPLLQEHKENVSFGERR